MNTDIEKIIEEYNEMKDNFLVEKGTYNSLNKTRETLIQSMSKELESLDVYEEARLLLAESSIYAKEQVKTQLENLVTNALQYVFDTEIKFEIDIIKNKTRTEAEFYVVSEQDFRVIRTKPEDARGGGVVDIVGLILRIALLHSFDGIEGPLILDEPVKMVSADYIGQVGDFLKQLSEQFSRQIIMATHNPYLSEVADKKYLVTQTDGLSQVEEVQ